MVALSCKFPPFPPIDFPPGLPFPLTKGLDQLIIVLTFPPPDEQPPLVIPPVQIPPPLPIPKVKGLDGFQYTPTFPPDSPPQQIPPLPFPPPLPIPKYKAPPLTELTRFCPIDGETTVG